MKKNKALAVLGIFAATSIVSAFSGINEAHASTGGKTSAQAITWVKSKLGKGIDFDNAYGNQCVDLVKAYYSYLGNSAVRGNGCDYATNLLPGGWKRYKAAQPIKGDILVYTGGWGGYGHVAIYESDYSSYHQNFNSHSYVEKITYKYNAIGGLKYWGVIRPDFVKAVAAKKVAVSGISLNKRAAALYTGKTLQLSATVTPSNATNKAVSWSSSDKSVATVDSAGKVTAKKKGTAIITAKTADGAKSASCRITVNQFTGVRYIGGWVYVKNDKPDYTYTGVAKSINGNWVFVRKGKYDTSYTGVARSTSGNWVFVKNGRYNTSFTGAARSTSGNWVYVRKGRYYSSFTGIAPVVNSTKKYYMVKGRWNNKFTGKYGKYNIRNGVVV